MCKQANTTFLERETETVDRDKAERGRHTEKQQETDAKIKRRKVRLHFFLAYLSRTNKHEVKPDWVINFNISQIESVPFHYDKLSPSKINPKETEEHHRKSSSPQPPKSTSILDHKRPSSSWSEHLLAKKEEGMSFFFASSHSPTAEWLAPSIDQFTKHRTVPPSNARFTRAQRLHPVTPRSTTTEGTKSQGHLPPAEGATVISEGGGHQVGILT